MMDVNTNTYVSAASSTSNSQSTTTKNSDSSEIDEEDFMTLLLAQIKNQDPLEPMDNSQFMTQLTQMNSLNVLKSIDANMEDLLTEDQFSNAAAMIGKKVEYTLDGTTTLTGTVSAVTIEDGAVMVTIDGVEVPLSSVTKISETA